MTSLGIASVKHLRLPLAPPEDEDVRSRRAGERVLASVKSFLEKHLKLRVNPEKSGVDRPWYRSLLGFSFISRVSVGEPATSRSRHCDGW